MFQDLSHKSVGLKHFAPRVQHSVANDFMRRLFYVAHMVAKIAAVKYLSVYVYATSSSPEIAFNDQVSSL